MDCSLSVLNLAFQALVTYVSGVDSVPPGKSIPHIFLSIERCIQLDVNIPPGQRHPGAVQSVGVLRRTREAERQTWSQLCSQQDEECELQYYRMPIKLLDVGIFGFVQFVVPWLFVSILPEARACCLMVIVVLVTTKRWYVEWRTSSRRRQPALFGRNISTFFVGTDTQEAIPRPLVHNNMAIENGEHCST